MISVLVPTETLICSMLCVCVCVCARARAWAKTCDSIHFSRGNFSSN